MKLPAAAYRQLPRMLLAFSRTSAHYLLQRDTICSTVRALLRKAATGNREKPYRVIPEVESYTAAIMALMRREALVCDNIAIDGLPGSGKSTLGRSLARRTDLKWETLYWKQLREPFLFLPGRIYENIRLIRTQNLDCFDLVIYLDCQAAQAQERVLNRDRDGTLNDVLDFNKLKRIGDLAFELLDGEEIRPAGTPMRMKIRPPGGFREQIRLEALLQTQGLTAGELPKEALLHDYLYGRPRKGLAAYARPGAYNRELLAGLGAALRTVWNPQLDRNKKGKW